VSLDTDITAEWPRTPCWIDEGEALARLLGQAAARRLMLAVGGNGGPRSALLLAADSVQRQLLIDLPFPAPGQALEPGTPLMLSTRIDGAALEFTATYLHEAQIDGEAALVLAWPEGLRYLQRRTAYRLGIPHEVQVPPAVLRDRNGPLTATLVDLSRHGAGALVSRSAAIKPGVPLTCTIRVDEVEFTADAEVRSCIGSLNRLRLGLQFGEISPAAAAKLSAAVAKLERVALRRAADRR